MGLYEHQLNRWIQSRAPQVDFVLDVGAQGGYDTYGLAHLVSRGNRRAVDVISFEPDSAASYELNTPKDWPCYSQCRIEIVPKFVGAAVSDTVVTLNSIMDGRSDLKGKKGLIKIDVEGAEGDVLRGAGDLLKEPIHEWLIEIHTKERIVEIAQFFCELNRPFIILDVVPLPLLGKDQREIDTFWLATI